MKSSLTTIFAILVPLALAMPSARADIAAFNEAVRRGDYAAAAESAGEVWQELDKGSDNIATIAREFGFITYLAGDDERAHTYARFLVDTMPATDDQPVTSELLLRMIEYRRAPDRKTRGRLLDALVAREEQPGVDAITVTGAQLLYNADWQASQWSAVRRSAALAAELLSRGGDALALPAAQAEMTAIAGEFFQLRRPSAHGKMVQLHNRLAAQLQAVKAPPAALEKLRWQAAAWVYAIEAWYDSYYAQTGSHVDAGFREYRLDLADVDWPACKGRVDHGAITFPELEGYQGMVGAVLLRLDFDADGRADNPVVLATAPAATFSERALEAARGFRWKPAIGVDATRCNLTVRNTVVPVLFEIDQFVVVGEGVVAGDYVVRAVTPNRTTGSPP